MCKCGFTHFEVHWQQCNELRMFPSYRLSLVWSCLDKGGLSVLLTSDNLSALLLQRRSSLFWWISLVVLWTVDTLPTASSPPASRLVSSYLWLCAWQVCLVCYQYQQCSLVLQNTFQAFWHHAFCPKFISGISWGTSHLRLSCQVRSIEEILLFSSRILWNPLAQL